MDRGFLRAGEVHEIQHCRLRVFLSVKQVDRDPVQRMTSRAVVVHLRLSISSVLLSKFEQLNALVKGTDIDTDESLDSEARLLIFCDLERLFQSKGRLVQQVKQPVIVNLKVAHFEGHALVGW